MRRSFFLLALAVLTCAAHAEWRIAEREWLSGKGTPGLERIEVASESDAATLHAVIASPARHTLAVIDDPTGEQSVATAGAGRGAIATVNGGYFGPDHEPLGLVLAKNQVLHPFQRASLLSGLVLVGVKHESLLRVAEYKPSPLHREALQAGPFLIDGGHPVPGLNAVRSAARTIVFVAKDGAFGFISLRSATLAEAAQILALPGLLAGHPITRALNLDGGSSCGMWVRRLDQGAFSQREFKTVRTYLSIVLR
ncbi:MAG TPA: phosphodiester glycosidase family protein [Chthoniobacteraceae bacterium]|nr:phosphodiester glycosidase family protein [Chthoniobacteraceae bacterium]